MKWINRKLKRRVEDLELQLKGIKRIIKLAIKCEECGKPAMYKICRRFKMKIPQEILKPSSPSANQLDSFDSLLCEECFNKLNRMEEG